ncbi:N-acetylneuraminate synthase [uncultured Psychrosphaera sp.]|jgi:N-acetylneuraminate synthase|uniref:N-acetylneuraminate synthase n=1 Tax=uncultured Psychrosphaera sp. TaxID=1403522 RepID=UPI0026057BAF|nr:N-acetylneuraminate synthase [uncultured Psychrosphaera sp.]
MTLIIAEAGVNHNGSDDLAFALVDAAYRAGADIVKFQTFKAKNLVTKNAKQADYQVVNTGQKESQYEMLKRLELSYETHHKLVKYCNDLGIEFLSTAFDSESLSFLVDDLGITRLKLPSGEITNAPLVLEHARTGCDLIVSTGMATLSEIEQVLSVIAFGYMYPDSNPTSETLQSAYFSEQGKQLLKEKVTLLHCTTEYPAPFEDINLNAMDTMRDAFKLTVGYSDHSEGIVVPIAAVSKGAVLIEKHFTLDKLLPGPDHKASLDPLELKEMISGIRIVEQILGDGIKGPRPSEVKNKSIARKSLVASKPITAGECFCEDNLQVKRPGNGLSPYHYWDLLDTTATQEYKEGELING